MDAKSIIEHQPTQCVYENDAIPLPLQQPTYQALLALNDGEMRLLKGDFLLGLELFESARKLDPENPHVYFRQALAFFEYGSEKGKEKALLLCSKKLKMALSLGLESFDLWHLWGKTLSLLGLAHRENHYFLEASEKYRKALSLSENQPSDIMTDLHWDYGVVWTHIAYHSGEALDLHFAMESFQKASSISSTLPSEFWIDFGTACLELATRINDIRLYVKAINCFKHAISTASASCYQGWMQLASALQQLYSQTHDEDHFSQANECFSAAAQLAPQEIKLWLQWAQFLCESGRRNQDIKRLRSCIEKCHRVHALTPDLALTLAIWGEALAALGDLTERLDLIYEAQNKISEAVQLDKNDPDVWYSYGMCLNSFGKYFNDYDYYYQAIEKFQCGISMDRTYHRHWHAIANCYSTIGLLEGDIEALERSCRFYTKAIDLSSSTFYVLDYAMALARLGEMTHDQQWLEHALVQFEQALNLQKNAAYIHPDWLFHYACTLDMLGDFHEEESYYTKAIEIFSHVLMIDPDFPPVHHRLALAFSHLGEFSGEIDHFYRAVHHFRLGTKHDEENDHTILDWGITLINIAHRAQDSSEADQCYREAEHKLSQSAKLGNVGAFYHLGCLYSLLGQYEKAMRFLEKADTFEALPPIEELLEDDWLDGVKETPLFRDFLSQLENRPYLHD